VRERRALVAMNSFAAASAAVVIVTVIRTYGDCSGRAKTTVRSNGITAATAQRIFADSLKRIQ
jgi:hypothetical protein